MEQIELATELTKLAKNLLAVDTKTAAGTWFFRLTRGNGKDKWRVVASVPLIQGITMGEVVDSFNKANKIMRGIHDALGRAGAKSSTMAFDWTFDNGATAFIGVLNFSVASPDSYKEEGYDLLPDSITDALSKFDVEGL